MWDQTESPKAKIDGLTLKMIKSGPLRGQRVKHS